MKRIRGDLFHKKFIQDNSYILDEDFLKKFDKNHDTNCLNKISKLLTSLIISALSYPECYTPKEQVDCLEKIKDIGTKNFETHKIGTLTEMQQKLYAFLHPNEYPKFLDREFKEQHLEQYNPQDYQEAIKKIFDNRLFLIGNYVRNSFNNVEKYTQDQKENGSWQDKIKAEGSKKNVSFA